LLGLIRLLVCGGRHFADRDLLFRELDALRERRAISLVIHGGQTGADSLAGEWAAERGIPVLAFPVSPAEWRQLGRRAGPLRNARMLAEGRPDLMVAFRGDDGTRNMLGLAKRAGIERLLIGWDQRGQLDLVYSLR
jgi:hypothetical protein